MPDLKVFHRGFRALTITMGVLLLSLLVAEDNSIAPASHLTGCAATYTLDADFDEGRVV